MTSHTFAVAMSRLAETLYGDAASKTWKAEPPTPHDLRRTLATRLSAQRVPQEDVAAVLNHVRSDVTGKHYDLYERATEKRRALNLWADALAVILATQGTVVPIAEARKRRR